VWSRVSMRGRRWRREVLACVPTANVATPHQAHRQPCGQPLPSMPTVENFPMPPRPRVYLGVTVLACAARVRTERLTMSGWVECIFLIGGLVQDACCCGMPHVHCRIPLCPVAKQSLLFWTMLQLARAAAGSRRRGKPQLHKRLHAPQIPSVLGAASGASVRLSCCWQWRLWTCPSTSCSAFSSWVFPPRVLVLSKHAGLLWNKPRPCPIQQPIPSLKNNIFFLDHLWRVRPTPLESRPGGPGRGRCSSWLVPADVKA
jgi:hypothetical protein